jgi:hypothetical protein
MTKRSCKLLFHALIGTLLFLGSAAVHAQQPPADPSANSSSTKEKSKANNNSGAATVNPTPQTPPSPASKPSAQIPTPPANVGGIVWVNTASGLYHKPGSRYFGKTNEGKSKTEADARKAGYRPAAKEQ